MEQGELIDKITANLYKVAIDAKYEFAQFAVPWGLKSSDTYYNKRKHFDLSLCAFAKDCGIMAYQKHFYYFNGRIYERVSEDAISLCYDQLMMKLGIAADYATTVKVRKDKFLNIILFYNQLHVRNDVIAFSNGVVDMRQIDGRNGKGGFHRFGPEWHVVDYHDYPYQPNATAPIFMRFLDEVLPDKRSRDILQMFLGLGLIQTSEAFDKTTGGPRGTVELCLVLLGSGANGKSVLFNVMCALFGKNHITSIDYDTMTADGDEGLRGRAVIRSAVFNWSSDSNAKKFACKNTEMFKRIASGEKYPYRVLGHDIAMSESCPYLIFSLNELPTISEGTRGLFRRLQFVNFDVTIPKYKQDPNLAYKIIENDLPGVFNWVYRGAREIKRRKFQFPPSDASLRVKVRSLMPTNPVYAWLLAYGIRGIPQAPQEVAQLFTVALMYECYKKFCENNDDDALISMSKFSRTLSNMNFQKKRKGDGIYFAVYGINEQQLRTPMLLDMLRDTADDIAERFESDNNSFIKND